MNPRKLAKIAGGSYVIIFFAAIFANFLVLDRLAQDGLQVIEQSGLLVRFGIIAFLITVVFDVVVAWALNELYKGHVLTKLSTYFRMMHAAIMGVAVFALPLALGAATNEAVLHQVAVFNTIWLIGLFFFGIHLILLGKIMGRPKAITILLLLAGVMYIVDTSAHFLMSNYAEHSSLFLALVAVPSILGEMSLAIWLLAKGGKEQGSEIE